MKSCASLLIYPSSPAHVYILGWDFIKEKKKLRKQENTHLFKKKNNLLKKKKLAEENTHSFKKKK